MKTSLKSQKAYTLVELMVAILVVGLLAATAASAYDGYRKRAYTQEPIRFVPMIAQGMITYFAREESFVPLGPTNIPPAGVAAQKVNFTQDPAWNWARINFSVADAIRYGYQGFETVDGNYVAEAVGDLDSDGVLSFFSIQITREGLSLRATPLLILNELE